MNNSAEVNAHFKAMSTRNTIDLSAAKKIVTWEINVHSWSDVQILVLN